MNTALIGILIAIASVCAVLIGRRVAGRKFYKDRQPLSVDEILTKDPAAAGLDASIYRDVVGRLAESVRLDAALIRPSDRLTSVLARDSWDLGEGQQQFEAWLRERVATSQALRNAVTVADVVRAVQTEGARR